METVVWRVVSGERDWKSVADPDSRLAKMKDGRTHLAHKAEHAVDLNSGALVAVTLQAVDQGDTATVEQTLSEARANVECLSEIGLQDVVADKGHHSSAVLAAMSESDVQSYLPERERAGATGADARPFEKWFTPTGGVRGASAGVGY